MNKTVQKATDWLGWTRFGWVVLTAMLAGLVLVWNVSARIATNTAEMSAALKSINVNITEIRDDIKEIQTNNQDAAEERHNLGERAIRLEGRINSLENRIDRLER